jgi:hypothetical protein
MLRATSISIYIYIGTIWERLHKWIVALFLISLIQKDIRVVKGIWNLAWKIMIYNWIPQNVFSAGTPFAYSACRVDAYPWLLRKQQFRLGRKDSRAFSKVFSPRDGKYKEIFQCQFSVVNWRYLINIDIAGLGVEGLFGPKWMSWLFVPTKYSDYKGIIYIFVDKHRSIISV